jgi:soluble cytochrome b562
MTPSPKERGEGEMVLNNQMKKLQSEKHTLTSDPIQKLVEEFEKNGWTKMCRYDEDGKVEDDTIMIDLETAKKWVKNALTEAYEAGRKEKLTTGTLQNMEEYAATECASQEEKLLHSSPKEIFAEGYQKGIEEAIEKIEKLQEIYPIDIWSDPPKGWEKDVDEMAKQKGYRIDNISAWYGRWTYKNAKHDFMEALKYLLELSQGDEKK